MASVGDVLFGKIAVQNGLVTQAKVDECLALQEQFRKTGLEFTLCELLVKKGYLKKEQADAVERARLYYEIRMEDKKFGELAVRKGLITASQMNECLQLQEAAYKQGNAIPRMKELIVQRGFCGRHEVDAIGDMIGSEVTEATAPKRQAVFHQPFIPASRPSASGSPHAGTVFADVVNDLTCAVVKRSLQIERCQIVCRTYKLRVGELQYRNVQIVSVEGDLDAHTFPDFERVIEEIMAENGFYIAIDFEDLNYISSAGIGVLVGVLQKIRDNKGDIRLANVPPKIKNIIDLLGFSKLIRLYDSLQGAVLSFKYV